MAALKTFRVPQDDPTWPQRSWGLKLGISIDPFRQHWDTLADHKRQELEQLGLTRSPFIKYWTQTLFPALATYHQVFGRWRIPFNFYAPDQDPRWPEATWGLHLGQVYSTLRRRSKDPLANVDVDTLRELGCDVGVAPDDLKDSQDQEALARKQRCWQEQVAPALVAFELLHGHLDVPIAFQVPGDDDDDDEWPKQSRGLQLGALVDRMTAYDVRKYVDLFKLDFPFRWTARGHKAKTTNG